MLPAARIGWTALLALGPAHAQDAPTGGERIAATTVAVMSAPLAGPGHFFIDEETTGWRLMAGQGIGLGSTVAGIAGLAVTGASPRTVAPFTWLTIGGVGLLGASVLGDIYGTISGPDASGAPVVRAPDLVLELGHRAIDDPVFAYSQLVVLGLEWRLRGLIVDARAWLAADDDNQRLELKPRWRLVGPRPDRTAEDGGFLDVRTGVNWHRYGTERFQTVMGELALRGRLDLHHVGRTLRGSFAEAEMGVAFGGTQHEGFALEEESLLLGGFAFGLYLGSAQDGWGEAAVYYDHRHDGYVAGLKAAGLGSGAAGHFGVRAELGVWGPWGLGLQGEVGSAWMGGLSLLHRLGGTR